MVLNAEHEQHPWREVVTIQRSVLEWLLVPVSGETDASAQLIEWQGYTWLVTATSTHINAIRVSSRRYAATAIPLRQLLLQMSCRSADAVSLTFTERSAALSAWRLTEEQFAGVYVPESHEIEVITDEHALGEIVSLIHYELFHKGASLCDATHMLRYFATVGDVTRTPQNIFPETIELNCASWLSADSAKAALTRLPSAGQFLLGSAPAVNANLVIQVPLNETQLARQPWFTIIAAKPLDQYALFEVDEDGVVTQGREEESA